MRRDNYNRDGRSASNNSVLSSSSVYKEIQVIDSNFKPILIVPGGLTLIKMTEKF